MRRTVGPGLDQGRLDAVLFDLDAMLADPQVCHEAPRTAANYRHLGDGQTPRGGASQVLDDRLIVLPTGASDDAPGFDSRSAMLAEQDARFADLLRTGARPSAGAVRLLRRLRAGGVATAAVAATRHAADILTNASLDGLLDVVVDGRVVAAMALAGKPEPASYLEAARRLGVDPGRAAVIDGAPAGVASARAGGFAFVVGVGRRGVAAALSSAGADLVVDDLGRLEVVGAGPLVDGWHLTYRPRGDDGEGIRETLCTLGNGYLATRGAQTWVGDDGVHYPGIYLAGVYNRLASDVAGQPVVHESIVNAPNWLPLSFSADGGPFLGEEGMAISGQELRLDLRAGELRRRYQVVDPAGRRTSVTERRIVSMAEPHLAAIELTVVADNWSGTLRIRSGIDAAGCADQTTEAKLLPHCHLRLAGSGGQPPDVVWLAASTTQSGVLIAQAARTRVETGSGPAEPVVGAHRVEQEVAVKLTAGARCSVEKVVATYTSRDPAISEPVGAARQAAAEALGYHQLLAEHRAAWARLWSQVALEVSAVGRPAAVVNLHLFHLLQVASPHVSELDAGLGARGLHGEGYEGHVFWDELFVFPVLTYRVPDISKALLRYRQRRLPAARRAARVAGEAGARFPWQSASDGRDETPRMLFNPRSGRWIADRSANQRHVGLAVAYDCWKYGEATGDDAFLGGGGGEVLFEVARHFADLARFDETLGRFRIRGVMGPDEFHDGYPWTDRPGVDDNAYTNVLAAWLLERAVGLAETLSRDRRVDLLGRLGIGDGDLARFDEVSRKLHIPFHDGVISQFAGYGDLEPIDLDAYRARYGNIGRLDLILDAAGDSVRRYQVAKQADTLMLFYLLSAAELRHTFARLGYDLSDDCVRRTIDYYATRVTHGSTLSRVVHAWVFARADRRTSWRHLTQALAADMADTQGGTTTEGIHLGAMAGTVDLFGRCYTGLETRAGTLVLDPALPDELDELCLTVAYRGHRLTIRIDHDEVTIASAPCSAAPVSVALAGKTRTLNAGSRVGWRLTPPSKHRQRIRAPAETGGERAETLMAAINDPVCGMTIEGRTAAGRTRHRGSDYYFCSHACQESFEADPERYAHPTSQ